MCGIVGLFALDDAVCSRMGELFTPMLRAMTERGPDSAGIAVYRQAEGDGRRKYSLYEPSPDFAFASALRSESTAAATTPAMKPNRCPSQLTPEPRGSTPKMSPP